MLLYLTFSKWVLKCASETLAWIDAGGGCTATESRVDVIVSKRNAFLFFRMEEVVGKNIHCNWPKA